MTHDPGTAPLIVTAELPPDILAWSDRLRRQHFPPERNWLKAHVTLFHAFAPSLRAELASVLSSIAGQYAPPRASIDGLMDLGKGTALRVHCLGMLAIRQEISDHFHGALTAQDNHAPRLHITIQNKVARSAAVSFQKELSASLPRRDFTFAGLEMHLYLGPHWEAAGRWPFRGEEGG